MRPSGTARRYAQAAFDVAVKDGNADRWVQQLTQVRDILQDDRVRRLFAEPNVSREEKLEMLPRLFQGLEPHMLNLLRILTTKHRTLLVPQILAEFEHLLQESRGVTQAEVTVARSIDNTEQQQIAAQLGRLLGKRVEIHTQVDESIIGGIVVRIGDQLIDGSVAGRLERLRQQLAV